MAKIVALHEPDSLTMPLSDGASLRVTRFRESARVALTVSGPGGGDMGGIVLGAERARLLASWLERMAEACSAPDPATAPVVRKVEHRS
jgi:hypothetical protein